MKPRKISDTQYIINNGEHRFLLSSKEEIFDLIEKALLFYMENGQPKERFAKTIERIGFEEVEKELLSY